MFAHIVLCIAIAIASAWAFRISNIRIYSFTTFVTLFFFILLLIPSYWVATGCSSELVCGLLNTGFDSQLYAISIIAYGLVIISALLSSIFFKGKALSANKKPIPKRDSSIIFLLALLYSITYLIWLPEIPLFELITNSNVVEATLLRLNSTHGLSEAYDLPFFFKFWRPVINILLPISSFAILSFERSNKARLYLSISIVFTVSFFQIINIEKAPLIFYLIGVFVFIAFRRSDFTVSQRFGTANKLKYFIAFPMIIYGALFVQYSFFMGYDDVNSRIFSRLFRQTESNYIQMQLANEELNKSFSFLPTSKFNSMFNIEQKNLSKRAMEVILPRGNDALSAGSAGGASPTQLFFAFGGGGLVIFFFLSLLLFSIDRLFINTIQKKKYDSVSIAIYTGFAVFFSFRYFSSVFYIFDPLYILAPEIYIVFGPFIAISILRRV